MHIVEDYDKARIQFAKALEINPKSATAANWLSVAYDRLGRSCNAAEIFEKGSGTPGK